MRLLQSAIAFVRGRQLERQFRQVQGLLGTLPSAARVRLSELTLREIGQAARGHFPHLHGTSPEERYLPWGSGTAIGFARARSGNPEVVLRGLALWLAVAYHETKHSPHRVQQAIHRDLLRVVRDLKALHGGTRSSARKDSEEEQIASWMVEAAA
jgi:hypothetical protein